MGVQVQEGLNQGLQAEQEDLQRAVYFRRIGASTNILDFFLEPPKGVKRYNAEVGTMRRLTGPLRTVYCRQCHSVLCTVYCALGCLGATTKVLHFFLDP